MPKTRRLVAGEEAGISSRQHRRPCSDCPWARAALPGWLGNLTADEWLRIAHGESTAECHGLTGADGPWSCAGLSIYRTNVGKVPRDHGAMKLPANRDSVFATPMEFKAHHGKLVRGEDG